MGRRKKKRTQAPQADEEYTKAPHTFVMHRGEVGFSVKHLIEDMRHVMEPYTASRLKVKKNNVLKDFVSVAGPLGITHFLIFSQTEIGTYLRLVRLPRGPTLTFKLSQYSLVKDVVKLLKRPKSYGSQFKKPPLLVLNNFNTETLTMKLMTTMFQNLFPSISIQDLKLSDIRRCVMVNYDTDTKTIDFRHYHIQSVPVGMSRGVKKLVQAKVPNMSLLKDISEYVERGGCGYGSESEGEEAEDSRVTLPQNVPGRGNVKSQQSAIRLTELGPRFNMQLIKVEDGLCSGEVLFHEYITKSQKEINDLKMKKEQKRKLKERRKRQQEENIKRKEKEKELNKQRSILGQKRKHEREIQEEDLDGKDSASEEDVDKDDRQWYEEEVGLTPDSDLFPPSQSTSKGRDKGRGRKRKHQEEREKGQKQTEKIATVIKDGANKRTRKMGKPEAPQAVQPGRARKFHSKTAGRRVRKGAAPKKTKKMNSRKR